MPQYVYILRCADGSLYVGRTSDVQYRLAQHNDGKGGTFTARRRPVSVIYSEQSKNLAAALRRERQITRWTKTKKMALVTGQLPKLKSLARCRATRARATRRD